MKKMFVGFCLLLAVTLFAVAAINAYRFIAAGWRVPQ